jgi:hypothetical protein
MQEVVVPTRTRAVATGPERSHTPIPTPDPSSRYKVETRGSTFIGEPEAENPEYGCGVIDASEPTETTRFWLGFDLAGLGPDVAFGGLSLDGGSPAHRLCWRGVGVTGYDLDDCLALVADMLQPEPLPPLRTTVRDIDVSTLDVDSRWLGVPVWRGVWYPDQNSRGPRRS